MSSKIEAARNAKAQKKKDSEEKSEKRADCLVQNQLDYYRKEYNQLKGDFKLKLKI